MTFSLRSILIVTAVIGLWLGATLSQSLLAVELAAIATHVGLLLALALAIWHRQPEQRAFWTGFCVLGLGNFLLANYFSAYIQTSTQIADALAGQDQGWMSYPQAPVATYIAPNAPYQMVGSGTVTTVQPPMSGYGGSYSPPVLPVNNYYRHETIRQAVAPLFTLLLAGLGGWVTLWVSRQPRSTENASQPATKS